MVRRSREEPRRAQNLEHGPIDTGGRRACKNLSEGTVGRRAVMLHGSSSKPGACDRDPHLDSSWSSSSRALSYGAARDLVDFPVCPRNAWCGAVAFHPSSEGRASMWPKEVSALLFPLQCGGHTLKPFSHGWEGEVGDCHRRLGPWIHPAAAVEHMGWIRCPSTRLTGPFSVLDSRITRPLP